MNSLVNLLPLILIFVVFYFILIRPQQRKSKERNSMLSAVKKGDTIVTVGGLHGTIQEMDDQKVTLRCGDVRLTFERSAIASVVNVKQSGETVLPAPSEGPAKS